jgi:hypothetical protein
MNARGLECPFPLEGIVGSTISGELLIKGQVVYEANDFLKMTLKVNNLPNRSGLLPRRPPRPLIAIAKSNEDGEFATVWHNEPAHENVNSFSWSECSIPIAIICNADPLRPMLFQVFDDSTHKGSFDHDTSRLIGSYQINLEEIKRRHAAQTVLKLVEPTQNPNINNNDPNTNIAREASYNHEDSDGEHDAPEPVTGDPCIIISHPHVERTCGILEYIIGGCIISLVVGIDFTSSNRDQQLHCYFQESTVRQRRNAYEQAILSIARVLEQYDSDKKYPVYGFGGKPPKTPNSRIHAVGHCFTLHPPEEEVHGVDGILKVFFKICFRKENNLFIIIIHCFSSLWLVRHTEMLYKMNMERPVYF